MILRTSSHRGTLLRPVGLAFTSLLVALGPAACGGDGGDGSSAPAARPEVPEAERHGGTVVVAGRNDIASMNAFTSLDIESLQHQAHLLFVTLLKADEREQPLPYLARSWSFGEDSASVTFELERGLTWHDGEPVTAQDVVFTFETMREPAVGLSLIHI